MHVSPFKGGGSIVVGSLFIVAPIVLGVLCLVLVLLSYFFNHLDGEDRDDCFILNVFLVSCDLVFCGSSSRCRR